MIILVKSMQIIAENRAETFSQETQSFEILGPNPSREGWGGRGVSHPGDREGALPVEAGLEPSFLHPQVSAHLTSSQLILGFFIC